MAELVNSKILTDGECSVEREGEREREKRYELSQRYNNGTMAESSDRRRR